MGPLKKLGIAAIAFGMVSNCTSNSSYNNNGALNESLSNKFERYAVGDIYDASCKSVERSRDSNIRRSLALNGPEYFDYDRDALALFSPDLTAHERSTAEKVIEDIPPFLRDVLYKQGAVFVFTRDSLVEAVPSYANMKKPDGTYRYYETSIGMYRHEERRLYLTFRVAKDVTLNEDGKPEPTGFINVTDSKDRVMSHEVGHFVDSYIGWLLRDRRAGAPGSAGPGSRLHHVPKRFSAGDLFRRAIEIDYAAINAEDNTVSDAWLQTRDYFFPKKHYGHDMHGENTAMSIARRETFAELWAEAQGVGSQDLKRHLPHAYELVKQIYDDLEAAYEESGRACEWEDLSRMRQSFTPS